MKKIIFLLFTITLFLKFSCDNSTEAHKETELISVSIQNTQSYEYKTGIAGDEEGASIISQANHFEISDITRNAETMWEAVYTYKPIAGFTGLDYVELELSTGSDGASPPTKIEVIKIEFIIN